MTEQRDEFGMTDQDHKDLYRELRRLDRYHRWRALKALWLPPVKEDVGRGKQRTRDARDDDWTFWRAVLATVGLVFDRHWTDKAEDRHKARTGKRYVESYDMAYWDAHDTYGGYDVMVLWLYPGCRVSIFSDGESFL